MSLRYVTRKLESQTLAEPEKEVKEIQNELEDSGSESDDEAEDESPANVDESSSLKLLMPVHFESETRTYPSVDFASPVVLCDDNYSSEEELKEIIECERQRKKSGGGGGTAVKPSPDMCLDVTKTTSTGCLSRSSTGSLPDIIGERISPVNSTSGFGQTAPAEKRKWSEMSGCDLCARDTDHLGSSGPCSCDEDESSRSMAGSDAPTTPVQFCTSPPVDVHKPRQHSASPPAKLFHMGSPGVKGSKSGGPADSEDETGYVDENLEELSAACGGSRGNNYRHNATSPHKRHRLTPRPHHLQRPCLDFEKMQQIKKRVVTSWRPQGSELSLFCW